jgi:hypothetical protein
VRSEQHFDNTANMFGDVVLLLLLTHHSLLSCSLLLLLLLQHKQNATTTNSSGRVTATADDNGRVKLFRSPCTVKGAAFREYCGHSSHVTNCRFVNSSKSSSREERLITVGGNDRCVYVRTVLSTLFAATRVFVSSQTASSAQSSAHFV